MLACWLGGWLDDVYSELKQISIGSTAIVSISLFDWKVDGDLARRIPHSMFRKKIVDWLIEEEEDEVVEEKEGGDLLRHF